ncbi:osmotically inducible protein C [Nocardioides baekrokdamisoli]|uniref:Osmotically inducible protein C n=2 Tax=Nocardioides baekrokdamisoli TaxID=1804624 RepID=A0A3G9IXY3_9ACTN|nr:osmotically inducible protein C [Nocardioides baekrokdamisoli]
MALTLGVTTDSFGHPTPRKAWQAGVMADDLRRVDLTKIGEHRYQAHNVRGGSITFGEGEDPDFTPVELLLAALAGCSAIDIDYITGKRAPFISFDARAEADKIRDEAGNHLVNIQVTFDVSFPDGEGGDAAREILPSAIQRSHERLCTVSRTVELGTPVTYLAGPIQD